MNDTFSSIWLEIGKPHQKKILLCVLYREWKYLNQPDNSSNTVEAQMARWTSFLDQWEIATSTRRECCVIGDVNLNFLTWMNPNIAPTAHTAKLKPMVTELFDRIMPYGFTQLVTEATRYMSGTEPSGLDHIYTNCPHHMSDIQVLFKGASDHRLVLGTRYTKSVVRRTRVVKKRSFKNFDTVQFIQELKRISWWNSY